MKNNLRILLEDVTFSKDEDSVDRQIDRVIYQAESEAIQVAKGLSSTDPLTIDKKEESFRRLSLNVLFEEDEKQDETLELDVGTFSNSILRCLLMYEKVLDIPDIIDIPAVIVKRAEKFLTIKYGEEIAKEFLENIKNNEVAGQMLQSQSSEQSDFEPAEQPLAVGASGGSSGAA
jgi:hypothetical protein